MRKSQLLLLAFFSKKKTPTPYAVKRSDKKAAIAKQLHSSTYPNHLFSYHLTIGLTLAFTPLVEN
jgi:hypothetical protein